MDRLKRGVVVAVAFFVALPGCRDAAKAACGPVEAIIEPTTGHVLSPATVQFEHHPPTSGRHYHDPPTTGVHESPIPEANQVAALERGWVLLQYGATATAADRAALRRLAGPQVIVGPAVAIDGGRPIAFTAWQHRQLCRHATANAAERFVARFKGKPAV